MRTSKLFAALAVAAVVASSALAQSFPQSDVTLGDNVVTPDNPYVDFTITFTPNQDFWLSEPGRERYAAFALRFKYDQTKVDLQIRQYTGGWLSVSSLPDRSVGSRLPDASFQAIGVTGLGAFQKLTQQSDGKVVVELGLGNATNNNTLLSGNFFGSTDPDGNVVPMRWYVHGLALGETYNVETAIGYSGINGQLIKVGPARTSKFNSPQGSWTVVPEPASMIALGSGLVGLLALRRRRSN